MALIGAFGEAKGPDAEVEAVLQSVRPALEQQLKKQFTSLEVVLYKTQVVAGTNFLIKVCSLSLTDSNHGSLYRFSARILSSKVF